MCVFCSLGSSKVGSMGPLPAFWGPIGLCTGFVGYSLEIACALAGAANTECSGSRDHNGRFQVVVSVFGVVDGMRGGVGMGAE
eukprot:898068-Pelagomonas_calceolata.AAC.1